VGGGGAAEKKKKKTSDLRSAGQGLVSKGQRTPEPTVSIVKMHHGWLPLSLQYREKMGVGGLKRNPLGGLKKT